MPSKPHLASRPGPPPAQLESDALGVFSSAMMGIAGTAPAFSLAATTTTLIAAVGDLAPAALAYSAVIMFGVTLSFVHLNRVEANAGAAYTWVSRILRRELGFLAGWALLLSSALFMVAGSFPAATATLMLVAPPLVADPVWVAAVAAAWLLLVTVVILKGIRPTSLLQNLVTGIEVAVLACVIVAAWVYAGRSPSAAVDWRWLDPTRFTLGTFADGMLVALFFFWGWDVALNLNEETRQRTRIPGHGALVSMLVVIVLFVGFLLATRATLTTAEIEAAGINIVFAVADRLLPSPWSYLAVIAVILSTIGTLETSIIQFTRTLFAMSRDGVLHRAFAHLHSEWRTPWRGTLLISGLGLLFLAGAALEPGVPQIIHQSVDAIGVLVCFYYALTGYACAWHHRTQLRAAPLAAALYVIWPGVSATLLAATACYALPRLDAVARIACIGGMALGAVLLFNHRRD